MNSRPLVWLTVCFAAGICLQQWLRLPFAFLCGLAVVALIGAASLRSSGYLRTIFIFCLMCLAGASRFASHDILPRSHIYKQVYLRHGPFCSIAGTIISESSAYAGRQSFLVETTAVQFAGRNRSCCGKVLVYAPAGIVLRQGDEVVLAGRCFRPYVRTHYGFKGYRQYLRRQGILLLMNVKYSRQIVCLTQRSHPGWQVAFARIANRIAEKIEAYVAPLPAAIVKAMVLGQKKGIPSGVNQLMMRSGTVHILVVSGFNVGIVAMLIMLCVKVLRLPRVMRPWLTIGFLLGYCLLTGASTPVVRATIMAVVFITAFCLQRQPDIAAALALAALSILAVNPLQLFDIGFQLSFASVAALAFGYPRLRQWLRLDKVSPACIRIPLESGVASLAAWLGTAGLIAFYFGFFSPVTVLANCLVVPLAALITFSGFSVAAAGVFSPALATLFGAATEFLVFLLLWLNASVLKLPGATFQFH